MPVDSPSESGKDPTRTRGAVFYVSDVWEAAEQAAEAVRGHGLRDLQVQELAERLRDAIDGYFHEVQR